MGPIEWFTAISLFLEWPLKNSNLPGDTRRFLTCNEPGVLRSGVLTGGTIGVDRCESTGGPTVPPPPPPPLEGVNAGATGVLVVVGHELSGEVRFRFCSVLHAESFHNLPETIRYWSIREYYFFECLQFYNTKALKFGERQFLRIVPEYAIFQENIFKFVKGIRAYTRISDCNFWITMVC